MFIVDRVEQTGETETVREKKDFRFPPPALCFLIIVSCHSQLDWCDWMRSRE